MTSPDRGRILDRQIRAYALPSLATLLAEPLLLASDTAMVGHLGTLPLAGLSLSSTIMSTIVGLCIFLAYATTSAAGKLVGAGRRGEAARQGIEGMWLALGIGLGLALVLLAFGEPILRLFGPDAATLAQAERYLRASSPGLPGMLLVLAATGTLRGFGDTKRPMYAATAGALANIPVNYALIYPLGWGVAGAGAGTAIVQTGMGLWMAWQISRIARKEGASLMPTRGGIVSALGQAGPLIVRTLCLRAVMLAEIAVATDLGAESLAANQITMTVWHFAAYGLDSLATAAQILIATAMGAPEGRADAVREVLNRCLRFGVVTGAVLGAALAAASFAFPSAMGAEAGVGRLATLSLIVAACCLPVASVAYILDGVLIGALDTRRLAWFMLASLAIFAPVAWALGRAHAAWPGVPTSLLFAALWTAYAGLFMATRAVTMLIRARSGRPFEKP